MYLKLKKEKVDYLHTFSLHTANLYNSLLFNF